jgi:hypothetical protein
MSFPAELCAPAAKPLHPPFADRIALNTNPLMALVRGPATVVTGSAAPGV